ncbi:DMT family transporter [Limnohabitans sp. Rim11]|uniref:DMT family transporter n=1 Tax=Limnohabitans sp. Rim11 TaxID=1100719 RepID=UPI000A992DD2|nr:DMT family transporter [Limnohabitans sp. Rim11]
MQALWMVLASLFFSSMSVCVKFAATHFNTFELVTYRGAIGTLIMAALCHRKGISLKTPVPKMHIYRSIVGVISLTAWFYAIAKLPLATAMTLNYMSGVWVAAFLVGSTLWVGTFKNATRQLPVVLTVIIGFAGVVMTLRPSFEQNQILAGLVGVASGMIAAMAYLQVAALGRVGEPVERTVFYFSLGAAVSGGISMLFFGVNEWQWPSALWLLPIGILAALGQWCMTQAYTDGATMVVANLQYAGIVFSALFGLFLFGDQIPLIGWAGMSLIVLSGIAATALRDRSLNKVPAEEH